MSNDIIARLRLNGQAFTEDAKATFSAFNRDAVSSAGQVKTAFEANFRQVQDLAKNALQMPRNPAGSLDLNVEGFRQATGAAEQHAIALREIATAAQRAAALEGDLSQETRLLVAGYQAAAVEAEEHARGLNQQAAAMERLQQELNQTQSATRGLGRASNDNTRSLERNRAVAQQLGFQFQDVVAQAASGTSAFVILAQQGGQVGSALGGLTGKAAAFGRFMSGPWGIALTIGVSALGLLIPKLLEGGDASEAMKEKQSQLGDFLDRTTGKIHEQITALDLLNRADKISKDQKDQGEAYHAGRGRLEDFVFNNTSPRLMSTPGGGQMMAPAALTGPAATELKGILAAYNSGSINIEAAALRANAAWKKGLLPEGAAKVFREIATGIQGSAVAYQRSNVDVARLAIAMGTATKAQRDLVAANTEATGSASSLIEAQTDLATSHDRVSRAEAYLRLVRVGGEAAVKAGGKAEEEYRQKLTAAKNEVVAARDAEEAARKARSEGNRERRASITLANQQAEAEKSIANLRGRFDAAPSMVDQIAAANRELDVQIAKYGKLKDARSKAIVADAQSARTVVEQAPARPFNDLVRGQEQQLAVQQLVLQGREIEAGVLEQQFQLMNQLGAKSVAELQTILAKAGVQGDITAKLREQAVEQQRINDAIEDQRQEIGIYTGAVGDAQRTFDQFLDTLGRKPGKAFKDLGKNLLADFKGLQLKIISNDLFKGIGRDVERMVKGDTGVEKAGKYVADQATRVGDSFGRAADAVLEAAGRLVGGGSSFAPDLSTTRLSANFTRSDYGDLRAMATDAISDALGSAPAAANDNSEIVVTAMRKQTAALVANTGHLKLSAEQVTNAIGGKLVANVEKLGLKLPKFAEDFGAHLGTVLKNAGIGMMAGSIATDVLGIKGSKTGGAIGGAIGGAAGQAIGTSLGGPVGGKIGSVIGSVAGGTIGSAIGGMFKKAKYGTSTIVMNSYGELAAGDVNGRGKDQKAAATGLAGSVADGISKLADQLGAKITGAPNITVGQYKDKYRVSTTGYTGKLNYSGASANGLYNFDDDQQAAIEFAVRQSVSGAVITGISQASIKIIKSGQDLEAAITKAGLIEAIPKDLKAALDPVGAAIDELNTKWAKTVAALKEGGATTEQMAQAQQLYALQLAGVKASTASASSSLKGFMDGLKTGSASPLSLRDQETAATQALKPYLDQIGAGKTIDQEGYQKAAQTYLDIERQLNGSTDAYFAAFDKIQAATAKAIEGIDNVQPISPAVANPFAEKTSNATQAIADMTEQTNDKLDEQTGYLKSIAAALGTSPSGFIGTTRNFRAA